MCLIIQKPRSVDFSDSDLKNFYRANRDGAGIMWAQGGAVEVEKITSPTESEWIEFYRKHATGRSCLIHLRWRTHGHINEDNTHPYYVGRGFWIMHNGILSFGNDADVSRSDTWHFIENHLKPALKRDPHYFSNPKKVAALGMIIGKNNRFAILGGENHPIIVNRDSGVVWGGAWFSNTYAWDIKGKQLFVCGKDKLLRKQPKPNGKPIIKKISKKSKHGPVTIWRAPPVLVHNPLQMAFAKANGLNMLISEDFNK